MADSLWGLEHLVDVKEHSLRILVQCFRADLISTVIMRSTQAIYHFSSWSSGAVLSGLRVQLMSMALAKWILVTLVPCYCNSAPAPIEADGAHRQLPCYLLGEVLWSSKFISEFAALDAVSATA